MTEAEKFDALFRKIMNVSPGAPIDEMNRENFPGWDSLRHAELLIALQTTFGLKVDFKEVLSLSSVKALREKVKNRKSSG